MERDGRSSDEVELDDLARSRREHGAMDVLGALRAAACVYFWPPADLKN